MLYKNSCLVLNPVSKYYVKQEQSECLNWHPIQFLHLVEVLQYTNKMIIVFLFYFYLCYSTLKVSFLLNLVSCSCLIDRKIVYKINFLVCIAPQLVFLQYNNKERKFKKRLMVFITLENQMKIQFEITVSILHCRLCGVVELLFDMVGVLFHETRLM